MHRNTRKSGSAVCAIAGAFLLLAGCGRDHPRSGFVAKVDGVELTPAGLATACDTAGAGRVRVRAFVNEWVVSELLYQEAVRRGVADDDEIRREVEETRRQLAISALLERELGLRDSSTVTDQEAIAFFDSSASTFVLPEDVVNISYVLFSERDAANTFRSRVLRGASWDEAVRQTRNDNATHPQLLQIVDRQYFTHASLFPEDLWKVARSLATNAVSFVIKTDGGFVVLQSHESRHQGEIPDFAYVREEVRNRLLIEARRARYEQLLRDLRAKHPVEVAMDFGDSTSGPTGSSKGE